MRKWLSLFVLALSLFASPVPAQIVYYTAPNGTVTNSGQDAVHPKSLEDINQNVDPVVLGSPIKVVMADGAYPYGIGPLHTGSATRRWTFVGNPANRGAVRVQFLNLARGWGYSNDSRISSYTTVRWITTTDHSEGMRIYYNDVKYDSLVGCQFYNQAGEGFFFGSHCIADSCRWIGALNGGGQTRFMNFTGYREHNASCPGGTNAVTGCPIIWADANVIKNSAWYFTVNGSADTKALMLSTCHDATFVNDSINGQIDHASGGFFGFEGYEAYASVFDKTYWKIVMNMPPGECIAGTHAIWCYRDSSANNVMKNSTALVTGFPGLIGCANGKYGMSFMLTNGGSVSGSVHDNSWINNVVTDSIPNTGSGLIWYENGARNELVEFCSFNTASTGTLFQRTSSVAFTGNIWRHNTFRTGGTTVLDMGTATASGNKFVGNLSYGALPNTALAPTLIFPATGFDIDSLGTVFNPLGLAAYGVKVGSSTGAPGTSVFGSPGKAVWGSPGFTDSTYGTFNPTVSTDGYAYNPALQDSFSGKKIPVLPTVRILVSGSVHATIYPVDTIRTVYRNLDQTIHVQPDPGYRLDNVAINDEFLSPPPDSVFSFNSGIVDQAVHLYVLTDVYTATSSLGNSGGTILPLGGRSVRAHDDITFSVIPDGQHFVTDVQVDGVSVGSVNFYTFSNVQANHTIQAFFGYIPGKMKNHIFRWFWW